MLPSLAQLSSSPGPAHDERRDESEWQLVHRSDTAERTTKRPALVKRHEALAIVPHLIELLKEAEEAHASGAVIPDKKASDAFFDWLTPPRDPSLGVGVQAPTGAYWYKNTKGIEVTTKDSDQPHVKLYAKWLGASKWLGARTKNTSGFLVGGAGWVYAGAHFEKPWSLADETTLKAHFEQNLERNSKMDKVRFYTTAENESLYVETSFEHKPSDNYWAVRKDGWFNRAAWTLIVHKANKKYTHDTIKDMYKKEHEEYGVVPKLIQFIQALFDNHESLSQDDKIAAAFFKKMRSAQNRRIE